MHKIIHTPLVKLQNIFQYKYTIHNIEKQLLSLHINNRPRVQNTPLVYIKNLFTLARGLRDGSILSLRFLRFRWGWGVGIHFLVRFQPTQCFGQCRIYFILHAIIFGNRFAKLGMIEQLCISNQHQHQKQSKK